MNWVPERNSWRGECPRCGITSLLAPVWSQHFSDNTILDVLECPEGHPFVISTRYGSERRVVNFIAPISGSTNIPTWLPEEYKETYAEMIFNLKSKRYRSAIAMAGAILDVHVNSILRNPGDKRKTLAARLEILSNRGVISADEFADGTITRLGRNGSLHPEDIARQPEPSEAEEIIDAVSSCLERFYKWRRAKALPAPTEQVGDAGEETDN